jgi:uncharacterized protein YpmS
MANKKKPMWQKWYFWAILGVIILGGLLFAILVSSSANKSSYLTPEERSEYYHNKTEESLDRVEESTVETYKSYLNLYYQRNGIYPKTLDEAMVDYKGEFKPPMKDFVYVRTTEGDAYKIAYTSRNGEPIEITYWDGKELE